MHRHSISQQVPPIYEVEPHTDRSMMKNRRMSTGGNRSWSEEEEAYLLRTRAQKMPYKHIAAHLNKTELACRLHYHQLSHGSHRRRRSTSVASTMSSASSRTTPSQYSMNYETDNSRAVSPVSSMSPRSRASSVVSINLPTNHLSRSQKPLLPKPLSQPPTVMEEPPLTAMRIQSQEAPRASADHQPGDSVDTNRLRAIYEAHRTKFWDSIANEYGSDVSAQQLEHVWKQGGSGTPSLPNFPARPPTPDSSPDTSKMSHATLPKLATGYQAPLPQEYRPTPASSVSGPPPFTFPQYSHPCASAIEPSASTNAFKHTAPTSAVDYHHRPHYAPPAAAARPTRFENESNPMSRSDSRDSNGVPATKIAAILTEDREPRRDTESPKAEEVHMRDA